jgi:hypothetical protein
MRAWRYEIGPYLHQFPALLKVGGMVVYITNQAGIGVSKLALDPILVVSTAVHFGGEEVPETVGRLLAGKPARAHDVIRVTDPDWRSQDIAVPDT